MHCDDMQFSTTFKWIRVNKDSVNGDRANKGSVNVDRVHGRISVFVCKRTKIIII